MKPVGRDLPGTKALRLRLPAPCSGTQTGVARARLPNACHSCASSSASTGARTATSTGETIPRSSARRPVSAISGARPGASAGQISEGEHRSGRLFLREACDHSERLALARHRTRRLLLHRVRHHHVARRSPRTLDRSRVRTVSKLLQRPRLPRIGGLAHVVGDLFPAPPRLAPPSRGALHPVRSWPYGIQPRPSPLGFTIWASGVTRPMAFRRYQPGSRALALRTRREAAPSDLRNRLPARKAHDPKIAERPRPGYRQSHRDRTDLSISHGRSAGPSTRPFAARDPTTAPHVAHPRRPRCRSAPTQLGDPCDALLTFRACR